ncbi:hypothetical protein ASE21_06535 [Flavobacterium sp. Root901]|uniref:hypothetical protein n=1 Tax=Flavobacterium sp. Root901 TaxID=1736605 RepID=UPI00070CFB49|nr:hypothetical protein [Flavobacterium sp. Root901]KRD11361.1 hypothetical protein ASE21_06535 [Flavobacterium sp. Root901]
MKYKYHLRPGYKSQDLLIEIFSGVEDENFMTDLLDSIAAIHPKMDEINDLWMNDEILMEMSSDSGFFSISKDIWDFAFIMSDNQECINRINSLLSENKNFQKVEVDFENYK